MERRDFLAMAVATPLTTLLAAARAERRLERIGLQLYTVRSLMEKDFEGTLKEVAAAGYQEVEFAGYYRRSADQIKSLLQDLNLAAPAAHVGLKPVREQLDDLIEQAHTIGHRFLIVPSLPESERGSLDAYRRVAAEFNRFGERCKAAGLRFGYHNHAFEFQPVEGKLPYDVLLSETDPGLVDMEVDLFWMISAKQDPLSYFRRHPGRFVLCHVKDMDSSGAMVDVGSGTIDFRALFDQADQAGLRHYIVEHDRPASPIASIKASYEYLSKLRF